MQNQLVCKSFFQIRKEVGNTPGLNSTICENMDIFDNRNKHYLSNI